MDSLKLTLEKELNLSITFSELSRLIEDIYDAASTNNWSPILKQILKYTHSNKAFILLQTINEKKPLFMKFEANFDYDHNLLNECQYKALDDPFYKATKNAVEGEYFVLDDSIDISTYKNNKIYQEFFVPLKSYYCVAGVLIRDGQYESIYAINRERSDINYDNKDLNLIKVLTPHLSRSMHIFTTLKLYNDLASISKSILDKSDKALVVCDSHSNIIIANKFAYEKLDKSAVIAFNGAKICILDNVYNKMLHHYIKKCCSLSVVNTTMEENILMDEENESVLITVIPLKNNKNFFDIDVPCCLVTINYQRTIDWHIITREFGLSKKELELLKSIFAKKKLNELTSSFGVTYNTLRTHLQAIFRKTDVHSQTELLLKINLFKK